MMFSSHRLNPPLYPEAAPMAPQKVKPARAEEERDGPLRGLTEGLAWLGDKALALERGSPRWLRSAHQAGFPQEG